MSATTVTLSSKGQFSLPKEIRETDDLEARDVFRLERLAPGKYLLEGLATSALPKCQVGSIEGWLHGVSSV
jgi:bifunctional DNA-binding transcriptional regulator/antitoxin component of YhaV-PrlF toxin-antitoxin module